MKTKFNLRQSLVDRYHKSHMQNNWCCLNAEGYSNQDLVGLIRRAEKHHDKQVREHNKKHAAAACNLCGGWTSMGGMSQYRNTPMGCTC